MWWRVRLNESERRRNQHSDSRATDKGWLGAASCRVAAPRHESAIAGAASRGGVGSASARTAQWDDGSVKAVSVAAFAARFRLESRLCKVARCERCTTVTWISACRGASLRALPHYNVRAGVRRPTQVEAKRKCLSTVIVASGVDRGRRGGQA